MARQDIKIPERYRAGVVKLAALSPAELVKLVDAVTRMKPTSAGERPLVEPLRAVLPASHGEDAGLIARALVGLAVGRDLYGMSSSEFVSIAIDKTADLELGDRAASFAAGLAQALESAVITVAAKAMDVAGEYEHLVHAMRVLTDLRPVFTREPERGPTALLVTHTLKLEYHSAGGIEEVYVAMHIEDLHRLKDLIVRAEAKEAGLRSQFAAEDAVSVLQGGDPIGD
ncbi:MAG: hypothetical protein ACYDAY_02115 [Candidatus Dormibacteria bacterium]